MLITWFFTLLSLLAVAVGITANNQITLTDDKHFHDATIPNIPTVPQSLTSITSEDSFTTLSHARFPHHSVRIKKSDFCDPTVS
jgi:hypothetical protein